MQQQQQQKRCEYCCSMCGEIQEDQWQIWFQLPFPSQTELTCQHVFLQFLSIGVRWKTNPNRLGLRHRRHVPLMSALLQFQLNTSHPHPHPPVTEEGIGIRVFEGRESVKVKWCMSQHMGVFSSVEKILFLNWGKGGTPVFLKTYILSLRKEFFFFILQTF